MHVDRFRDATEQEDKEDISKLNHQMQILFLWEEGALGKRNGLLIILIKIFFCPMLAVGAASGISVGVGKTSTENGCKILDWNGYTVT